MQNLVRDFLSPFFSKCRSEETSDWIFKNKMIFEIENSIPANNNQKIYLDNFRKPQRKKFRFLLEQSML